MGLFSDKKSQASESACSHENLDPRWNPMEDAGNAERVNHYICRRCAVRIEKPAAVTSD